MSYNDRRQGSNGRNYNSGWQGKNRSYNGGYARQNNRYVGAPYNFVPVGEKVLKVEEPQMKNRAILKEELLSGEINYTVMGLSDLYIGTGKDGHDREKGFTRDEYGQYIIPGSSMRGLIRENVQILGMSSVEDDIDDYRLMYRNVGGRRSSLKKTYEDILGAKQIGVGTGKKNMISVLLQVEAGYIVKKKDGYVIYRTKGGPVAPELGRMNYYVLSEREVQKHLDSYPLFEKHSEYAMHDLRDEFRKGTDRSGRTIYTGTKNKEYRPGCKPVSFSVKGKTVTGLDEPGILESAGFLMSTGPMNNKKVHYVIPDMDPDESKAIEISEEDLKAFSIDFENKKNTLGKNQEFFDLPKDDLPKPIFFIENGGRLYFGFTPRLRLFYEHSVKEGLKSEPPHYDFTKSIFGMSKDDDSFRSKVSFSDAILSNDVKESKARQVILAAPKPTSYWDYISQAKKKEDSEPWTYNDDGFELRGLKQYWLRNEIYTPDSSSDKNEKIQSRMMPLGAGAEFKGKVRYQNLTEAELGLLLWAMYVDDDASLNIGMGKPLGYGVIKIRNIKVRKFDLAAAYSCDDGLNLSPFTELSVKDTVIAYKNYVKAHYSIDIDQQAGVKALMLMKTKRPDAEKIKYMSIQNRDYQNRTQALQSVEEVLNLNDGRKAEKDEASEQENFSGHAERESSGGTIEPEVKRATAKPEKDVVYDAAVTKVEGGTVRFTAQTDNGMCNGKTKFSGAEKKTLKERFKKGTHIRVKCTDIERAVWEILTE